MKKGNILFICTENSARSQMAEGFAKKIAPESIGIFSAGTEPAPKVHPMAAATMNKHDIDISSQYPKLISDLGDRRFDLMITLCRLVKENCPILAGAPSVVHWGIDDPASGKGTEKEKKKAFEKCAKKIKALVYDLLNRGYSEAFISQKNNMNTILENIADGIIAHDLQRKIFFFSESAAKFTGLAPANIIGKDCHEVFNPQLCGINCSFCEGDNFTVFTKKQYTTVFHDLDGERKECEVTLLPIKDEQGKIQGVIASLRNQTNLKSLERQLGKEKSFKGIIGLDHKMLQIFQQIQDVATYDSPVNIFGETGTGKELVAQAIHNESLRRDAPFVPINCGALPEGLIESELFGHLKGSFSGAVRDKKGRFELADKGTIFLDEVAELPKHVQVKFLRFLQEGILEKVGSEKNLFVDVRIISATNKNLKEEVQKGNFRDDLFYRLNVIPINLPRLCDRKNDIPLLADHFLQKIDEQHGNKKHTLSDEAMSLMLNYEWPGNVRELENSIQFSVIKCKKEIISPDDLPMELVDSYNNSIHRGPSKKLDTDTVRATLKKTGGNKAKAAKLLGVGRATLYRFLNDFPEVIHSDL